ncbi:hypothetical protein V8C86DRAFT_3138465 [Haematococcus lacustris]
MQNLTAPGMCASQLLALDTTALFNTPLTPMELMPALDYFTMDVAQLLRDYLGDSSITVQVPDFCAGDRISTPRFVNRTLVTVTLPTLYVAVNLLDATPERLLPPFGLLGQLLRNCRGALMARDSLGFFNLYAMSFNPCLVSLLPSSPPPPSPPPPNSPPAPTPIPITPPSLTPCSPSAPPFSSAAANQLPAASATGQSVYVPGPFPVGSVFIPDTYISAVLFGPIYGDGGSFAFTTCFQAPVYWDSWLMLYEAASVNDLNVCGGQVFPVQDVDDFYYPCSIGSLLSTLPWQLTSGTTYWLMLREYEGGTIPNSTVLITSSSR